MTKATQSHKQSEVDAESVPSSLRIVCDDASSINLQAAETAEEGKPALRKFSMVAYTGGAMRLGGWPYPVVVDLAGMRVTRKGATDPEGSRSREHCGSYQRHRGE